MPCTNCRRIRIQTGVTHDHERMGNIQTCPQRGGGRYIPPPPPSAAAVAAEAERRVADAERGIQRGGGGGENIIPSYFDIADEAERRLADLVEHERLAHLEQRARDEARARREERGRQIRRDRELRDNHETFMRGMANPQGPVARAAQENTPARRLYKCQQNKANMVDDDSTDCPVCFETFDNVTHFKSPCGHKICVSCYTNIIIKTVNGKNISCPICRDPIAKPTN